jgi:hypothetical protein
VKIELMLSIIAIIVIPSGVFAGTWGFVKRKVGENTKWLDNHEKRIQKIEQCTIRIETIINERIPPKMGERLGSIETEIKDIKEDIKNGKTKRR